MSVQPVPDGYTTVTPYVMAEDIVELMAFWEKAFGAEILRTQTMSDGEVGHAEVRIGNARLMLGAARGAFYPMPTSFYVYVEDCDALHARAVAAGAKSILEPTDMFYGDRHGGVRDIAGNLWWIATHIEDVDEEELARRAAAH